MFIVTLFSLKFNIFYFDKIFVLRIQDPDPHWPKKLDPVPHKVNADPKHCFSIIFKKTILCLVLKISV
jgi:hypothetical protein